MHHRHRDLRTLQSTVYYRHKDLRHFKAQCTIDTKT